MANQFSLLTLFFVMFLCAPVSGLKAQILVFHNARVLTIETEQILDNQTTVVENWYRLDDMLCNVKNRIE